MDYIKLNKDNRTISVYHRTTTMQITRAGNVTISAPTNAAQIANTPAGNISATNVQAAINELDTEKASNTALTAETNARIAADTQLQTNIDDIETGSTEAIEAEEAARIAADGVLQTNITNETNARIAADATKQPLDSDLTTIAGLTPTNNDVLQYKSGAWANRTTTQLKIDAALDNVTNTSDANKPVSTAQQTALDLKQNLSDKGQVNGYAELDGTGKVPSSQLPAYVDDVIEVANFAALPVTGTSGIIYVTLDTNLTYRWSGSAYVEISQSLALGETSTTAYRGDRGKIAYDHSQLTSGNPHNVTKTDVGLSNVDNTSDATKNSASVTLTNKTVALGSNTITGTTAEFNTALTDNDFATLAGTETLTNKTLGSTNTVTILDTNFTIQDDADPTRQAKFNASSISASTIRTISLPNVSDTLVARSSTDTLTNKTLTNPLLTGASSGVGTLQYANSASNFTITFPAATGTLYISGSTDVSVADGGTGRSTSTTAYGILAAGTTATGVHQTISPGTSGQFLKSGGASALGAFANIVESDVTNLVTDLAAKATDSLVVHLAGTETITGVKTFQGTSTVFDDPASANSLTLDYSGNIIRMFSGGASNVYFGDTGGYLDFAPAAASGSAKFTYNRTTSTSGSLFRVTASGLTGSVGAAIQYGIKIDPVINQTLTGASTMLLINPSVTAVGSGSQYLIDAQLTNVQKFAVDHSGNVIVAGTVDGRDVSTDGTKLDGIEALADVTDAANVAAAGAIMDGDFSSNGLMTRTGAGTYSSTTAPSGAIVGTTDSQTLTNKTISGASNTLTNISADSTIDGTTNKVFTATEKTKLGGIEALADVTDATNVDAAGAVMNSDTSTASMSFVVDEDNMVSNSATKVPTQQSVKAYVDANIGGGGAVDSVNGQTGVVSLDADDIDDTSTTKKFTTAGDISKLAGIEALADVTDTANVTSAGALMDSEVTSLSGIKTLTVPDSTTISAFGKTLVDDADASTARTTLGLVIGTNVQAWDADLDTWAGKTAPSGTVVGTTDSQTLTNKTLTTPIISSISNTGTLTLPTSTDTLVGRDTTDTLTNKTLGNTNTVTLKDTLFTLQDDGDATKLAVFQLSGITTGTTRTLTVPNSSGTLYVTGGTDVSVADGGTGRSTSTTAYGLIAAGTTATGAHQTLAAGATTEILVGGGASALPVWTTATGSGAPVRATSPTLVTPALGAATATTLTTTSNITVDGTGNAFVILDRNASTNFSCFQFMTNGAVFATVGGYNNSTNNLHFNMDAATAGKTDVLKFIVDTEAVFNDGGGDLDFRVESDTNANMLFVDASTDRVGIANAAPAVALDVTGEIRASTAGTNSASVVTVGGTQTLTNKTLTAPVISTITNTGTVTLPTSTDTLVGRATTDTLTNKRITQRVGSTTSSATPTINTDNVDAYKLTALAANITSMTTNLSGTPTDFQRLTIRFKDDGTGRTIAWGASFEAKGRALPTTTVANKVLTVMFIWDSVTSKWGCVSAIQEI